MTFESQPKQPFSERELLEEEKNLILKQLQELDLQDQDFLEREEVRLESEILLVKDQLADYFPSGFLKEDYDPTEFSPEDQVVINRLLAKKEQLIKEKKRVRGFLARDKDEIQSQLLDTLADIQSKLRNL